jgi:hypothetical protein
MLFSCLQENDPNNEFRVGSFSGGSMARKESPLSVTVKGALAGLVGTVVVTVAMKYAPQLMQQMGLAEDQQQQGGGGGQRQQAEPTETLANKVAEGVFEQPISEDTRQAAGQAIHWSYGAAWGAYYGIVQSSLHLPGWLHATLFGGLINVVASTLVPAMHVVPPPKEQPSSHKAMMGAINMLYGWVTALTFRLLCKDA